MEAGHGWALVFLDLMAVTSALGGLRHKDGHAYADVNGRRIETPHLEVKYSISALYPQGRRA